MKKVVGTEATLQADRAALATEREKAYKSGQALKPVLDLSTCKDEELE